MLHWAQQRPWPLLGALSRAVQLISVFAPNVQPSSCQALTGEVVQASLEVSQGC